MSEGYIVFDVSVEQRCSRELVDDIAFDIEAYLNELKTESYASECYSEFNKKILWIQENHLEYSAQQLESFMTEDGYKVFKIYYKIIVNSAEDFMAFKLRWS